MSHKKKVLFFEEYHELPSEEVAPTLDQSIQNDTEATLDERLENLLSDKKYEYPCQASESHTQKRGMDLASEVKHLAEKQASIIANENAVTTRLKRIYSVSKAHQENIVDNPALNEQQLKQTEEFVLLGKYAFGIIANSRGESCKSCPPPAWNDQLDSFVLDFCTMFRLAEKMSANKKCDDFVWVAEMMKKFKKWFLI